MIWSLSRIVIFVCLIAALALGADYLLETQGGIRIAFGNTEVTLTPLMSAIAAVAVVALVWLGLKLAGFLLACLRFLTGDETAISRWFNRNRERRGFEALSESVMALASGEGRTAITQANKAERYLGRPDLTNLIAAQAAEMVGDTKKAETVYKRLLTDDKTRFVGVRGLMRQRLADGDVDTALKLAEKAFAIKPRHVETQDTLLRLQADKGDWEAARKTLGAKLKHGSMPRDLHRRRDAVLALAEAKDVFEEDATIEAREAAIEANRLSPDLVPAAVLAARAYIEDEKPRYATRVLKKAWTATPHPDLARAFAAIEPGESPKARIKRFQHLLKAHIGAPEVKMLAAELQIANEDFPAARRAIGDLAEKQPTARVMTIMAAIARGEGADDVIVKGWLTRALTAPRGPQWVCDNCGTIAGEWEPVCSNCGTFDGLAWTTPKADAVAMPRGEEMLPMIVGSIPEPEPEPKPEDDVIDAETIDDSPAGDSAEGDRKSA